MNGFERFNIKYLSPTTIAQWDSAPATLVLRRVFGVKGKSNPNMWRGEGEQEAVAWLLEWQFKKSGPDVLFAGGGSAISQDKTTIDRHIARLRDHKGTDWIRCAPLYTRPAEQAVTEAMVEAAAKSLWPSVSPTWEEAFNSPPSSHNGYQVVRWLRKARAALKAAMEAGR